MNFKYILIELLREFFKQLIMGAKYVKSWAQESRIPRQTTWDIFEARMEYAWRLGILAF